jgi:hypothetical protein
MSRGYDVPDGCDVLVVGDEVESVLTAVSAARAGASVYLARRSPGRLGGLSVRGGLSYMDITWECVTGLFEEFLRRTGVVRVALNPDRANAVLADMLEESGVRVFSGLETQVSLNADGFPDEAILQPAACLSGSDSTPSDPAEVRLHPRVVIDATPDADIARTLGVPFVPGLGKIFGEARNFLGISPVFRLAGVSVAALQAFEQGLRERPGLEHLLALALPWHPPELRAEYVTRPTFAPEDMDYLDILNPVIGVDYHLWRHGADSAATYPDAALLIDGANISRLADGTLGFNGLVADPNALNLGLDELLALSRGGAIPEPLCREMTLVERYLRERAGLGEATVIPPEALYVRQTVNLRSRNNMTARLALEGGVPAEKAVGSFSYWLDLRGVVPERYFPGESLPKPLFNISLDVALPPAASRLENLAFVGRSAGYSPIGQGAGRIVQHNALLGEAIGVAAALAALEGGTLTVRAEADLPRIQGILKERRGGTLRCEGHPTESPERLASSELLRRDNLTVPSPLEGEG